MASEPEFIFLLCSERSGSNLVTRVFDSHALVCGPSPTHLGSDLLDNLYRYGGVTGGGADEFMNDFLDLFEAKIGSWASKLTRKELTSILSGGSPLDAYLHLYQMEAKANNKPIVFIKENRLYEWAPLLLPVLDRCRFIYVCRDPRDMALSWKKAPALRGGVVRAAGIWADDQEGFLRLRAELQTVTGKSVPCLSYENLLQNCSESLEAACSALGLDFDPNMIEFYSKERTQSDGAAASEWQNLSRPLMTGNVGKFRDELSTDEIRYVEAVCEDSMAALGYKPDYPTLTNSECLALRQHLEPQEPWHKSSYDRLPEAERMRRRRQHDVFLRIRNRPWRLRYN